MTMTPEQRRVRETVEAAWVQRRSVWRVRVDPPVLASWSDRIVPVTLAHLPLTRDTAAQWHAVLALGSSDYLGHVLTGVAQSAVAAGALVFPEPGEVRIAFAHRDPVTEDETALGWGFTPQAVPDLRIIARHAPLIGELAGGPDVVGAAAARRAVELAASTLSDARSGPAGR